MGSNPVRDQTSAARKSTAALNCFVPGLGYLMNGRKILGTVFLVSSVIASLFVVYLTFVPLIDVIGGMLKNDDADLNVEIGIGKILICIGYLLAVWFYGILEPLLRKGKGTEK